MRSSPTYATFCDSTFAPHVQETLPGLDSRRGTGLSIMGSAPSPFNVAGEGSEIFDRAQTQNERISADQIPASGERHKTAPPPDVQDAIAAQTSDPQETGPWPAQDLAQSYLDQHPLPFRASFRRPNPSKDADDEATGPYTRRPSAGPRSDRTVDSGSEINRPVPS
ncbi:hypothetical protein AnigIFM60653_001062 [Aspergillus niger]|nr:hypothetical protein AnigIFM60653_001062 [Aspergillus niger]